MVIDSVEGLEFDRREDCLCVRIDRGDRNSFSGEMMRGLVAALEQAKDDADLRFLRVSARGENFCLGRDKEGASADELRLISSSIVSVGETLRTSRLVSICEVPGNAAGFGVGLIAACDVAIVAESAEMWFPELEAGMAPTVVLSWLVGTAGRKRAFDLVTSGRRFSASEAERLGIVTEVVAPDHLQDSAEGWYTLLRARKPEALRDVKRFLATIRTMDERSRAASAIDALVIGALRNSGPQLTSEANLR